MSSTLIIVADSGRVFRPDHPALNGTVDYHRTIESARRGIDQLGANDHESPKLIELWVDTTLGESLEYFELLTAIALLGLHPVVHLYGRTSREALLNSLEYLSDHRLTALIVQAQDHFVSCSALAG